MTAADRVHLDYISLDKLDPIILMQYPRLGHPVILMDGEAPSRDLLLRLSLHESPPIRSHYEGVYSRFSGRTRLFRNRGATRGAV
jgi:hypothetical protein